MFGQSCGDCRLLFLLQAGHGCGLHPAFPAPSIDFEGARLMHNSGTTCRGKAKACSGRCLSRPRRSSPGLTGRSSIPETAVLNRDASGILDAPLRAGHDGGEWCRSSEPCRRIPAARECVRGVRRSVPL